jgi:hypothetical protein
MGIASLIIGLLSILGMAIGIIPLLGWFNWLNIPFAFIGLVLGVVSVARSRNSYGLAGAIMCGFAIIVGTFRLAIGGGIL